MHTWESLSSVNHTIFSHALLSDFSFYTLEDFNSDNTTVDGLINLVLDYGQTTVEDPANSDLTVLTYFDEQFLQVYKNMSVDCADTISKAVQPLDSQGNPLGK